MIPLHSYSTFSFLRGVIPPDELARRAKEAGYTAIALTDIEGMHGYVPFARAAVEAGIKPIFGAKFYFGNAPDEYIIALAKNNLGYSQLCRAITRKKLAELSPDNFLTPEFYENCFLLTPSLKFYELLHGEQTYYEVPLLKRDKGRIEQKLFQAEEKGMLAVITNPLVFAAPEDYDLHKVVTAIRERRTLGNLPAELLCDEANYFLKLEAILKKFSRFSKYLQSSDFIASQCKVNLELGKFKFPIFPDIPAGTSFSVLEGKCLKGLQQRVKNPGDEYYERLRKELEIIDEMSFCDYFLVVWDIIREANRRGILHIGRGSAANSLVSYCLGFTSVDPIEHDLFFERFMNRQRLSPPDIDLDFSWRERDEIIKYIFDKYGYERVAMISTVVTFRARSAFRETAKVFGFSDEQITPFTKLIPWTSAGNLNDLPELFPESRNLPFHDEPWKTVVRIAAKLSGFPRHQSIHPSGIVITPDLITNHVALEFAKNKGLGLVITQPDMYSIEDLGLVKIDILSQRALGVLRDTLNSIEKRGMRKDK